MKSLKVWWRRARENEGDMGRFFLMRLMTEIRTYSGFLVVMS